MKDAVRDGRFDPEPTNVVMFDAFADLYLERYVRLRGLRSGDEIEQRLAVLKKRWHGKELAAIRVGEIEDLIQDLKAKKRRPATLNRWLALLRHMFNWAIGREYVTQTPFRRGTQALIKFERENNRRVRRVTSDEETRLLEASNSLVHMLIVAALDTGMWRGELLDLRLGDIDWDRKLIHIRPEIAKSQKGRVVPIGTTRLRTLLEWLRMGSNGEPLPDDRLVFLRESGDTIKSFRTAWELTREKAGLSTVRFHDLRSEYASRLVEHGVPLSQVRDLLGHCSIIVTERYDRVRLESLKAAVATLDDGQPFKILSRSADQSSAVESVSSTH
jgi:integrase